MTPSDAAFAPSSPAAHTSNTQDLMDPTTDDAIDVASHGLPVELWDIILRYAIEAAQQTPRYHHLSSLAVVCRKWQESVEPINFASLQLVTADLSDFDTLVDGQRRAWLRRIWLEVKLPKYGRQKNDVFETVEEQRTNNIHFTTDIQRLFEMLARWPVDACPAGLEFELSVRSPSDPQELGVRYLDSKTDFAFLGTQWLGLHGLPMVDVITEFAVLRRCWRNIHSNAILTIVSSLPRITKLWYEPSQQFDPSFQEVLEMGRARMIPFLPKTLRRISMFQHFDLTYEDFEDEKGQNDGGGDGEDGSEDFVAEDGVDDNGFVDEGEDGAEEDIEWVSIEEKPRACAVLAKAVALRSFELEELSVAFMFDAWDFFQSLFAVCNALPLWPSLRWLSLTSYALQDDTAPAQLNSLFLVAAKAARRMPALRAMEIFNTSFCSVNSSGAFRYFVGADVATIEWEGSWTVHINDNVERMWRKVAKAHSGRDLVVGKGRRIQHRGMNDFLIHNLATRELVVHDISASKMALKRSPAPPPRLWLR